MIEVMWTQFEEELQNFYQWSINTHLLRSSVWNVLFFCFFTELNGNIDFLVCFRWYLNKLLVSYVCYFQRIGC